MSRGFAVSGRTAPEQIRVLAATAEALRYASIWITVPPGEGDPVAAAAAALEGTEQIDVGLGLIPLDEFAPAPTAAALAALPAAQRLIVGLGVGGHVQGAAQFWTEGAELFKASASDLRIAVGSYGQRVLAAGGAVADAVLLNWMTPARVAWGLDQVERGAEAAGRKPPGSVYVFVPTAVGSDARKQVSDALAAMRVRPYHRRHQEEMGIGDDVGLAIERPGEDVEEFFEGYGGSQAVVYPLSGSEEPPLREWMQALAPSIARAKVIAQNDKVPVARNPKLGVPCSARPKHHHR